MSEKNFTVIGIDDEEDILSLLEMKLKSFGINFISLTKNDSDSVLQCIDDHIDNLLCVILDYQMPERNGLEVAQIIRDKYGSLPIILSSGYLSHEQALELLSNNISGFLNKPYDDDELAKIEEAVFKVRKADLEDKVFFKNTYFEEADNLYEDIESVFLSYSESKSEHFLTDLFRYVHTLKGSSGIVERPLFTNYMHKVENYLKFLQENKYAVDEDNKNFIFICCDDSFKFLESLKTGKDVKHYYKQFEIKENELTERTEKGTYKSWSQVASSTPDDAGDVSQVKKDEKVQVNVSLLENFLLQSSKITMLKNMLDKLAQSILKEFPREKKISNLVVLLDEMNKINSNIQNQIIDLRKIPATRILNKVKRTVRDLSYELNKKVDIEISDNNVKLDPGISEIISNSLIHLIRNSLDHGIETPEVREKKGKPPEGLVELILDETEEVITMKISDNGKGIDKSRITEKAIENGLYKQEEIAGLKESQILELIFSPGLSTAKTVSEISGRGVGMDMVKSSIEKHNGSIVVESKFGEGTTFNIVIPKPKSVSIINSLIVRVQKEFYAIDQNLIFGIKDIETSRSSIQTVNDRYFIEIFNQLIPIVDVESLFAERDPSQISKDYLQNKYLLLLQEKGAMFAVLVDDITGSEESVINKLIPYINKKDFFKGATFLGDGSIGLVLNIFNIGKYFESKENVKNEELNDLMATKNTQTIDEICYLIFDIGYKHKYAILLEDIFRFERFDQKDIRAIGSSFQVCYDQKILHVHDLFEMLTLPRSTEFYDWYGNEVDMIVFKSSDSYLGLPTKEILGTFNLNEALKAPNIKKVEGFSGNFNHPAYGLVTVLNINLFISKKLEKKNPNQIGDGTDIKIAV